MSIEKPIRPFKEQLDEIRKLATKVKTLYPEGIANAYAEGVSKAVDEFEKMLDEAAASFPKEQDYMPTSNVGSLDEFALIEAMYKWKERVFGGGGGMSE